MSTKKSLAVYLKEHYSYQDDNGNQAWSVTNAYSQFTGATLDVMWGDGTMETIPNYTGQTLIHNYSSSGFYHINTVLTFGNNQLEDGLGITGSQDILVNATFSCYSSNKSITQTIQANDWRLVGKLWVSHNYFGHHVGSHTHSWKYFNGNWFFPAGWRRKVSHIYTNVLGKFRNGACVLTETKTGSDTENQERVTVTVNKTQEYYKAFGNGEIQSEHNLTSPGGTYISLSLTLTPCP